MSESGGLLVHFGSGRPAVHGVLQLGWQDAADVPFRLGEDFPFEDSAVDAMAIDEFIGELPLDRAAHLLLECRRVIRPGGLLHVSCPGQAAAGKLRHLAALVGLAQTTVSPRSAWFGSPIAQVSAGRSADHSLALDKPERQATGEPLVSILIPAYNPPFFGACLDSALAQTYGNLEIVICDDSSGREIEDTVASRAGRRMVRYERNDVRLRPRRNFVRCFERANGEFVKFLCDDDLLAPTCVERLLGAFRDAPDIALATSARQRIDALGRPLPDQPATMPIVAESSVIAGYTLANAMLMAGLNTIGEPSTAMFRKADFVAEQPEYFHFRGVPGHGVVDMVMWTALLLKGNAVYLRERLSSFRVHPNQRQHDPVTQQRSIASIRSLQSAWLELNVHERQPPHLVLARPFPPGDADWQARPVLGVSAVRVTARDQSIVATSEARGRSGMA